LDHNEPEDEDLEIKLQYDVSRCGVDDSMNCVRCKNLVKGEAPRPKMRKHYYEAKWAFWKWLNLVSLKPAIYKKGGKKETMIAIRRWS
jgi:hypothetical protein